jgi:hypothetical protein
VVVGGFGVAGSDLGVAVAVGMDPEVPKVPYFASYLPFAPVEDEGIGRAVVHVAQIHKRDIVAEVLRVVVGSAGVEEALGNWAVAVQYRNSLHLRGYWASEKGLKDKTRSAGEEGARRILPGSAGCRPWKADPLACGRNIEQL